MALLTWAVLIGLARAGSWQVSARLSGAIAGRRVVIDPGHGGPDPGAVGRTGLKEKDLVLDISRRLRKYLGRAGVYVTMVREDDRDFGRTWTSLLARKREDLSYRADLANRTQADLYLSIHANSIPDPRWSGAQVFYNPGRSFARELAASIQSAFAAHLGPNYRRAEAADYRVLNDVQMPAATVEVGFLSNQYEEALLGTDDYREKIAAAIFQGVLHYFLLRAEREEPPKFLELLGRKPGASP